jgi:hypothetical protein
MEQERKARKHSGDHVCMVITRTQRVRAKGVEYSLVISKGMPNVSPLEIHKSSMLSPSPLRRFCERMEYGCAENRIAVFLASTHEDTVHPQKAAKKKKSSFPKREEKSRDKTTNNAVSQSVFNTCCWLPHQFSASNRGLFAAIEKSCAMSHTTHTRHSAKTFLVKS